jgi:hypothetical protein
MRKSVLLSCVSCVLVLVLAWNGAAQAQEALPTDASPNPAAPPTTAPAAPESAPPAEDEPWYKTFKIGAFVDTYASLNYNLPKPQQDANLYHPYDSHPGFGIAWAGIDTSIEAGPVGAVAQLRLGPAVKNLALNDFNAPGNIGNLQNAYLTWKPQGKEGNITLMGGKFDTLFGAEVAVSHQNINYTRGALYNLAQPFFHTGLRADGVFGPVTVKLMAVNGWNNTIDNNQAKSFGGQVSYTPVEQFTASVGYMGGAEQPEQVAGVDATGAAITAANPGANSRWRHLGDVVLDVKPHPSVRILANATFVADKVLDPTTGGDKNVNWWGVSLMGRYAVNNYFGVGGRFEFIRDKDGQITAPNAKDMSLITGTLTLEAIPVKNIVIRLDNRIDRATEEVFANRTDGFNKNQLTTTLGLVVKTN